MNDVKIFDNDEFGEIRTVMINGEPWFVGSDVAVALGYANPRDAVSKHVDGEDKNTVAIRDGNKGNPNVTVVNESGLYSLIFGSQLDSAKRFKRWVTSEVLPAIRKTGGYGTQHIPLAVQPDGIARLINATSRLMEREGSEPHKVAENAEIICRQYGIQLSDDFVRKPMYEQGRFELMMDEDEF